MSGVQRKTLLNIDIDNITLPELLRELENGVIYTPNIDHFVLLQKNSEFYHAYRSADYRVLDSQVLYLLLYIFRRPLKEKISGADLFPMFCEYHKHNPSKKMYILGGLSSVATTVRNTINKQVGNELIVGAMSPSVGFENDKTENDEVINAINKSGANVLVVGLGTPKQEMWIYRHKHQLPGVKIFMGVGATLDFIAGTQKRAPRWVQKAGLEWLFRLLRNPRRLARRYLIIDMQFFYYFILDVLNLYSNPFEKSK